MEEEKSVGNNEVVGKNIIEPNKSVEAETLEKVDRNDKVNNRTNNGPVRSAEIDLTGEKVRELVETPRSQPVRFYVKHEINKELIEGLVGNPRFNDSLLAMQSGKMECEAYHSLPVEPTRKAMLKKMITKKEDIGIAEDVLVEIADFIYLMEYVILDIKEDRKRPFILGTPFLTITKAEIRYDKGAITLKSSKSKINFFKTPEYFCKFKEREKEEIDPISIAAKIYPFRDSQVVSEPFKKLYKPTNNNLRTSSNSTNKTEDTTPRYNNDNQSRQFGNQRTVTVAGARETVGSPVVQKTGIQCFNCKGFGHYARECRKPKRVKDYAYHKEKMMMCKQAEQGVPLQAEQADWLEDTDEEIDEQELEAHYSYMAKIQEVSPAESSSTDTPLEQVQNHDENDVFANVRRHSEQPESINDTYVLEKDDSNVIPDSSNICTNDNQVDQNAAECVDERAALANLIANLTLDTEENKTILKQLKKANASLTQELKECKTNLDESSRALGEATSSRDSSLIALQTKQTELEKYTALNDLTSDYKILQTKLNDTLGLLAIKNIDIKEGLKTKTYEISVVNQKHDELVKKSLLNRSQFEGQLKEKSKVISDLKVKEGKDIDTMIEMDKQIKFLNEILYKRNQSIQTIHMLAPKCATYHGRSTFANPKYLKKAQSDKPCLYEIPYDTSDPANRFAPDGEEIVTLAKESRSKLDKDTVKPYNYTYQNSLYETFKPPSKAYLDQLERAKKLGKTIGDKRLLYNSILFIVDSGCTKAMYWAILKLLFNFVGRNFAVTECHDQTGLLRQGLNHNLFSVGQFCDADLEVAFRKSTCFVRDLQGNDLLTGSHGSDLYTISLQETTSQLHLFMAKQSPIKHGGHSDKRVPSSKEGTNICFTWTCVVQCAASCKLKLLPVRTERAQEFCTAIHAYFKEEGIEHQTSTPRTPEQNGVVERRNRTLVEAARTMLSASKLPLSFWAEAVGNACYTQIRIISSYPLMERRALSHSSMTGNLQ
ncbi:retrovirus-related pol polyprotein from transposon TNT 1-94 [Tanacetum coccineum]